MSFPPTASNVWNIAGQITPNPAGFGWFRCDDGAGNYGAFTPIINTQLGASYAAISAAMRTQFCRWRLAYQSVTVEFDGPALSNQGTVAVAQVPLDYMSFNPSFTASTGDLKAGMTVRVPQSTQALPTYDYPNFDNIVSMPEYYVGEVKEGFYAPLKLTRTHQQWRSIKDQEMWANAESLCTGPAPLSLYLTGSPGSLNFPFPSLTTPYIVSAGGATGGIGGTPMPPMGNDLCINFAAKNMSQTAGLVFMHRVGIEVQVLPGTNYSSMQTLAPQYDPLAIETYFAVSRQLKDAFPASYNSRNGLMAGILQAVKTAARFALPIMSRVPGPVGDIAGVINDGITVVERLAKAGNKSRGKSVAPEQTEKAVAEGLETIRKMEEAEIKKKQQQIAARKQRAQKQRKK